MGRSTAWLIRPRAALILGRVSNLPTLLSNALAAASLVGGTMSGTLAGIAALVLFYVGGMYLNDAVDAGIDAKERPTRPIPQGDAARWAVYGAGAGLLLAGCLVAWQAGAPITGLMLAGAIIAYDLSHKHTPWAPFIMGSCRLLCYGLIAAAASMPGILYPNWLMTSAVGLMAYVVGLTYVARQEAHNRFTRKGAAALSALLLPVVWCFILGGAQPLAFFGAFAFLGVILFCIRLLMRCGPGDVPRAVGLFIAGIAFYDATVALAAGALIPGLIAAACFPLTRFLQRYIPGT